MTSDDALLDMAEENSNNLLSKSTGPQGGISDAPSQLHLLLRDQGIEVDSDEEILLCTKNRWE
eukprot:CAMPEP_0114529636 /NCGR_PEP_ID=MMETSP0109-20121206/24968_1 /TAXON_ID=29199 /ORGANISM="Chlorarachnion reptans, Strain CCCM449" /LENGTH=62 /DNA_ID=CAMNT_0001712107 /DNA_START=840 /DNA_END=1028 /DNA_ORIENTATION=+